MNIKELLIASILSLGLTSVFSALAQAPSANKAAQVDCLLLTSEGTVEVIQVGRAGWVSAKTNQVLNVGDRVRTGARSRATIRLSNLSLLRVNELTTLQIQAPPGASQQPGLNLKSGATYFFHRDKPGEMQFQTPLASGAIRGTEFHLAVADDGRTELALLEGEVDLRNEFGQIVLKSGDQGTVEKGRAPARTAVIDAVNIIQWTLYYPGVLDVGELELPAGEKQPLADSLDAYKSGDLLSALRLYPEDREPASDPERVYRAALLLAVGQVAQTEAALNSIKSDGTGAERTTRIAEALRRVIAAVKFQTNSSTLNLRRSTVLATEWLAESYYLQSRSQLEPALKAARSAVMQSPQFGFAWVRVAELEFSFGRISDAMTALEKGLQLSPRNAQAHALKGFLLSSRNKFAAALASFDRAIALDGALANAWLGRGLCLIREGHETPGRESLQTAATLEPRRAVLRSYLGKAFSNTRNDPLAEKELARAQELDPNDPTAWLYAALLEEQQNRINEGVRDLEHSQELNNNRGVFRSRLLLDQDRAVRSANLAAIYRDAGMFEVSLREASRAVNYDYGNYSAHLFLANSYDALRDPKQINLRYETPWFSELLLADLLAPVGGGSLSQNVSQQEYSRLFEGDHLGVISGTEYFSTGNWVQYGSQYGILGNTSYALDAYYRSEVGQRPNNDLRQLAFSAKFKQQLTPQDSVFLQALYYDSEFGDVSQYYNQQGNLPGVLRPSTTLRVTEKQEPNLFLGYHHEWSPGSHTLFLAGRLDDTLTQSDPAALALTLGVNPRGEVTSLVPSQFSQFRLDYRSTLEAYSAEGQQIWQTEGHTLIGGVRYQTGDVETAATLYRRPTDFPPVYTNPASSQRIKSDLDRVSFYGYYLWQIVEPLQLTAGLSYDRLTFPRNSEVAPISNQEGEKDRFSPKVGLLYTPWRNTALRGVYTRSLGGIFYDQSVRLEPTQIAGFNQAFRSIVPESVVGLAPGSEFETWGVAWDQKFNTATYLGVIGQILKSDADRTLGAFAFSSAPPAVPASTNERLEYEEKSLTVTLNQLLSKEWALGASYRLADADLQDQLTAIPLRVSPAADRNLSATLHQLDLYALFNHSSGFFARADSVWSMQSNRGYAPDIPGDDFWQFNAFVGYRFLRRAAEVRLGLLNLTDRDYRLNPLTLYSELPRERTFTASLKFYF